MFNDEIDIQKGIAYMAGKKEIYIKIAGAFTKNVDTKISELRQFLENDDFNRLTIEFHGLKSSAASVGSTALPKLAMELEAAGKSGDNEFVKEKFEEFLAQYQDTCGAINEAVAQLT